MFDFQAQGYFTWAVLNEKDRIVRHAPKYSKNLILNQGLNGIAVRSWADSFIACAIGTGSSSPSISQVGLDTEVRRTNAYLDLQSANSSSLVNNQFILRRTFVFPKEGGNITYREAGFSYSATGPNALFSRVNLPNVLVSGGERLIIQYELVINIFPTTLQSLSGNLKSKTVSSAGVFQYQYVGLKGVNGSGNTYDYDSAAGCNEPSTSAKGFLSTNSSVPATFGSTVDRSGTTFEKDTFLRSYTTDSFFREKVMSAIKSEGRNQNWRSMGLGSRLGSSFSNTGLVYVSNAAFPKSVGQLDLVFRFTWGRSAAYPTASLFYWKSEDEEMLNRRSSLLDYFNLNE